MAVGPAQQYVVVPSLYANQEGPAHAWIAGLTESLHVQMLVDAVELGPVVGHTITGIRFRRSLTTDDFPAGSGAVTVTLSSALRGLDSASPSFDANRGLDATTCFQGAIQAPASPAPGGPTVPWSPANEVTIPFQTGFAYAGGVLCVEFDGVATSSGPSPWYADAAYLPATGIAAQVGNGCGTYVESNGAWAWVDAGSLRPGCTATFLALGTSGAPASFVLAGIAAAPGLPLDGYGMPGCASYIQGIVGVLNTAFLGGVPVGAGSIAALELYLPSQPWMLGARFASQWLDWAQPATSNANAWTVANDPVAGLSITVVRGFYENGRPPASGEVIRDHAPVLRFDYP